MNQDPRNKPQTVAERLSAQEAWSEGHEDLCAERFARLDGKLDTFMVKVEGWAKWWGGIVSGVVIAGVVGTAGIIWALVNHPDQAGQIAFLRAQLQTATSKPNSPVVVNQAPAQTTPKTSVDPLTGAVDATP